MGKNFKCKCLSLITQMGHKTNLEEKIVSFFLSMQKKEDKMPPSSLSRKAAVFFSLFKPASEDVSPHLQNAVVAILTQLTTPR